MTFTIVAAMLFMLAMGLVLAVLLALADAKLAVQEDPKVTAIVDVLPGANCGGCGVAGCRQFAEAVVAGKLPVDGCVVGGPRCAKKVAEIMGVEISQKQPRRPVVHCAARENERLQRQAYYGVRSCAAANLVNGVQGCTWGCLGFGDCVESCHFDAIRMVAGLPVIDYDKCTGCGACVRACPRDVIGMIPFVEEKMMVVACNNRDPGKLVRRYCKLGCIACGVCEKLSAGLFQLSENLSSVNYENYQKTEQYERVAEKCPTMVILQVGRGIGDPHEQIEVRRAAKAAAKKQAATATG